MASDLLAMLGGTIGAHEVGLLPALGARAGAHGANAGYVHIRHTSPAAAWLKTMA